MLELLWFRSISQTCIMTICTFVVLFKMISMFILLLFELQWYMYKLETQNMKQTLDEKKRNAIKAEKSTSN